MMSAPPLLASPHFLPLFLADIVTGAFPKETA